MAGAYLTLRSSPWTVPAVLGVGVAAALAWWFESGQLLLFALAALLAVWLGHRWPFERSRWW